MMYVIRMNIIIVLTESILVIMCIVNFIFIEHYFIHIINSQNYVFQQILNINDYYNATYYLHATPLYTNDATSINTDNDNNNLQK